MILSHLDNPPPPEVVAKPNLFWYLLGIFALFMALFKALANFDKNCPHVGTKSQLLPKTKLKNPLLCVAHSLRLSDFRLVTMTNIRRLLSWSSVKNCWLPSSCGEQILKYISLKYLIWEARQMRMSDINYNSSNRSVHWPIAHIMEVFPQKTTEFYKR